MSLDTTVRNHLNMVTNKNHFLVILEYILQIYIISISQIGAGNTLFKAQVHLNRYNHISGMYIFGTAPYIYFHKRKISNRVFLFIHYS